MSIFSAARPEELDLVAPDGRLKGRVEGVLAGGHMTLSDLQAEVDEGDELRRLLPDGHEDVFLVTSVDVRDGPAGAIAPHLKVGLTNRGAFPLYSGGHYSNLTSTGVGVAAPSRPPSGTSAGDHDLFHQLVAALDAVADARVRSRLVALAWRMKAERRDRRGVFRAYQQFVGLGAGHLRVIEPFLPALLRLMR